jgi:hypothetical protein
MIPHGRTAIDRAGIATIYDQVPGSITNSMPYKKRDFPQQLNPHAQRYMLWDQEQVQAYHDGLPIPELPTEPHPLDLLDDREAAQHAGLSDSGWRSNLTRGAIEGTQVYVCGVRHWVRGTIRVRPRGRPKGTTDSRPRRPRGSARSAGRETSP